MHLFTKHKISKFLSGLALLLLVSLAGAPAVSATTCSDVPSNQQQACSDAQAAAEAHCNELTSGQDTCWINLSKCNGQPASSFIGCLNSLSSTTTSTGDSSAPPNCNGATSTDGNCVAAGNQLDSNCSASDIKGGIACSKIYEQFIKPLIAFLAVGVGVIVVIMVIMGGVQYATAGGDSQAVANARKKIFNAVLALVTFILLYALLNWIVPGGLPL